MLGVEESEDERAIADFSSILPHPLARRVEEPFGNLGS
jgi:hypothetical protein